jgi:hypothetical protein
LPASGKVGKGVAGYGVDAHFGPPGSGFANRFYTITALNDMIYQTMADGSCKPFANLSTVGAPVTRTIIPAALFRDDTISPGETVTSIAEPSAVKVNHPMARSIQSRWLPG